MTRPAGPPGGGRDKKTHVKTAKRRTASSTRWLQRQLNDPYVHAARREGWRSRAAYKLVELDDRLKLLRPGQAVVDLGAAPGGWSQVAAARVRAGSPGGGALVAVDVLEMDGLPGVRVLRLDMTDAGAGAAVTAALGRPVDVVLSDMAPSATGHKATDHLRIVALVDAAADFAMQVLQPGGLFVAKVWQGGADNALLDRLKRAFGNVRHVKPPASRKESAEVYLVASGFRGAPARPAGAADGPA